MRSNGFVSILLFLTCAFLTQSIHAEQQVQHWLAAQHDWGASRGFFLSVQNIADTNAPATLPNCRIQLGVGDGKQWHFVVARGDWKIGQKYDVQAVIKDAQATLFLDGRQADSQAVVFAAAAGSLSAGFQPSFLIGPADYRVVQSSVHVVSDEDQLEKAFDAKGEDASAALRILNPTIGSFSRLFTAGKSVSINASFEFMASGAGQEKQGPLVDQYGQAIAARFPGKVTSDQQLSDEIAKEQSHLGKWPAPEGYDRFGGWTKSNLKSRATGFFRVEKKDSFWWLISPEGNLCFYLGVCDAPSLEWEGTPVSGREHLFADLPPHEGQFAAAWKKNIWSSESADAEYFIPHMANLIRKYGEGWQKKATDSTVSRIRAMGFKGFGKWSQDVPGVPNVPVLFLSGVDKLTTHPDPWDLKVQQQVRGWLEKAVGPRKNDAWVVGWSINNEKDAFPSPEDVKKVLAADDATPAKVAMLLYARSHQLDPANPESLEALRVLYADALFDLYYRTIKQVDPNHLYLGNWVTPNWWINEHDWEVAVRHCDVVGFDRYALSLSDEPMNRLLDGTDKPMLCGEFSFPADYSGLRGQGTYPVAVRSEEEAAACYQRWIADSAVHPRIIGALYFQYRDQPLLGRGPGAGASSPILGENFAFGLIDITDRLKIPLCQGVRDANLGAVSQRLMAVDSSRK